jgi:hypothetical protein
MPSKNQVSVVLSPAAVKAVARRLTPRTRNKSRVVSQVIERHAGIMRASPLRLSDDELEHLRRITEGWELTYTTALGLPAAVEAADVPEDLSVAKGRLVEKLTEWGAATAVHAIELLETNGRTP